MGCDPKIQFVPEYDCDIYIAAATHSNKSLPV